MIELALPPAIIRSAEPSLVKASFLPGLFPVIAAAAAAVVTPISARLVGTYTVTFTASNTSGSVNVPSADLGAADPNKQLFFYWSTELEQFPNNANGLSFGGNQAVTMPGSAATAAHSTFLQAAAIAFTGSGDQAMVLTAIGSMTETSQVTIIEVINGIPISECAIYCCPNVTSSKTWDNIRVPEGAVIFGACYAATDTATLSWTGLTEIVDQDAGGMRIGAAANFTPAVSGTDVTVSVTASSGLVSGIVMVVPNKAANVAKVQLLRHSGGNAATATVTITNTGSPNRGDYTLLLMIGIEGNATLSTITLNSVDISSGLLGSVVNTGPNPDLSIYAYAWPINSSNSPSGSLVITYSASVNGIPASIEAYIVESGTIGTPVTANANDGSADLTISIAEGGTIVAMEIHGTDTDVVSWSNITECLDGDAGPYRTSNALRSYCAAESNRAVAATFTSQNHVAMAIPINP